MIPFFIVYRKTAIPYFAALLSHSLIGDFFTGGTQLFWPFSTATIGTNSIEMGSLLDASIELTLFAISLAIMFKARDLHRLVEPKNYNAVLLLPAMAVLAPLLAVGRGSESSLPSLLIAPSLFWLVVFAYSVIADLRK